MSQIKVTITDETGGSSNVSSSSAKPVSTTINTKNGSIKSKEVKENQTSSKALAVASMIGSQSFSYMTSNVGKWTGSTKIQTNISNVVQLKSVVAIAYVNPALAIANVGVNLATTAMNTAYEQRWDAYQKEYNRLRVGEVKGRGR